MLYSIRRLKWRERNCTQCGTPFQSSREDALFCSGRCRQKKSRLAKVEFERTHPPLFNDGRVRVTDQEVKPKRARKSKAKRAAPKKKKGGRK